jgi:hypothetical protein
VTGRFGTVPETVALGAEFPLIGFVEVPQPGPVTGQDDKSCHQKVMPRGLGIPGNESTKVVVGDVTVPTEAKGPVADVDLWTMNDKLAGVGTVGAVQVSVPDWADAAGAMINSPKHTNATINSFFNVEAPFEFSCQTFPRDQKHGT